MGRRVKMSPLYTLLLGCIVIVAGTQEDAGTRDKKVFSLFSVVTFPNDVCTGKSGDTGTCQSTSECTTNSGTADGNCASGFGVCCTFSASACASTITQNTSYITNPTYPTAMTATSDTTCAYTVTPLSADICQLRLDFVDFDLVDASTGVCTDTLVVTSGSGRTYPTLCGTLTGQHLYTETGRVTSGQTLTFTIKATTGSGKWKILVRQIECSATWKAPSDCSQYYTGTSGTLTSFNFGTGNTQLQSQDMTLCIRREQGYCSVGYAPTQGTTPADSFHLTHPSSVALISLAAGGSDAHIGIPGGIPASVFSGSILAGVNDDVVDAVIYQNGGFLGIEYRTEAADQASTNGFHLTYNQIPCAFGVSS